MIWYHGTSHKAWDDIQKSGYLYQNTWVCPAIEEALSYGDIILKIDYTPIGKEDTRDKLDHPQLQIDYDIKIENHITVVMETCGWTF